jgi:anti-sigma regulatory factor (Ser/Thr protein kinase)
MEVPMDQCMEVPANQDGVLRLIAFADEVEQHNPLSFDQSYLLRLVIEEITTNIVKYGYRQAAPGVIQLQCSYSNGVLRVTIRDHGRPFDPREHPDPDMGDDPATRQIGGLGLFLVRESADELQYSHDPTTGWNELVVMKTEEKADV